MHLYPGVVDIIESAKILFFVMFYSNPATRVCIFDAVLVPVPNPDKLGGLRQEGHPA